MNAKRKGRLWELIAHKTMEIVFGLKVHTTERKMVPSAFGAYVSLNNDIFGCIDHIGKKKGDSKTWWIQTTAGGGIGEKAREITALGCWGPNDVVEIWRGVGGKKGQKFDHRFKEKVELDRWYFQRYRLGNGFKMVKGDVIEIPDDVIKAVASKPKPPKCACGKAMKKQLERKIGKCSDCIRSQSLSAAPVTESA